MGLRNLFIAKTPTQPGKAVIVADSNITGAPAASVGGGSEGDGSGTPVFLTPQSLVTFPGASLAVLILWKTIGLLIPAWSSANAVAIILALLVGALIYSMSLTEAMDKKDKILGAFLALLNACYVALFVIGVPLTFQNTQPAAPAPPAAQTNK
jgi:hypothetical protein